jgi:hypothetical protein
MIIRYINWTILWNDRPMGTNDSQPKQSDKAYRYGKLILKAVWFMQLYFTIKPYIFYFHGK